MILDWKEYIKWYDFVLFGLYIFMCYLAFRRIDEPDRKDNQVNKNYQKKIIMNIQIREIASECLSNLKGSNHVLVEQLFESKVRKLYKKELPDFQNSEPNFNNLKEWFWDFHNKTEFYNKIMK